MTKAERLLQRVAVRVDLIGGVPTIGLECGHAIKMPDMTMTRLSYLQRKIANGAKLVDLCPMCKEVPHPVCNPDPYWSARMRPSGHSGAGGNGSNCEDDETRNSIQASTDRAEGGV